MTIVDVVVVVVENADVTSEDHVTIVDAFVGDGGFDANGRQ